MEYEWIITIFASVMASTGFWTFINNRSKKKVDHDKLLLGLANQQLIIVAKIYIDRGSITIDEYRNFEKYLWEPYVALGGNGLGSALHDKIKALPIKSSKEQYYG